MFASYGGLLDTKVTHVCMCNFPLSPLITLMNLPDINPAQVFLVNAASHKKSLFQHILLPFLQ